MKLETCLDDFQWNISFHDVPRNMDKNSCCFAYPTCINRGMQIFCWNKRLGPSVTKPVPTFSNGSFIFSNHTLPTDLRVLCLKHLFVHSNHTKASPTGLPKSNMDTFWKKHMLYETITLTLRLSNMAGWKMHKETEQPTKPAQLSHPIHSKGWSRGIFGEFPQATQPIPESSRPKNERGTPPKKWRFGFR